MQAVTSLARRHALIAAYVVALVPALAMAVAQPVWSLVDEAHHFDFIVQLGHHVYPVADTTQISSETLYISQTTGVYRAFYPPGTYPTPDLTDGGPPPPGMSDAANAIWMQRHMWQLSREAIQTPGYYVAMVPVWWVAHSLGGPFAAVYALRIVNALLLAALAPMAIVVARILMPDRPVVAALAALFTILLPGLDLNLTRISNDTLGAVLGGLVVVVAAREVGGGWSWRKTALTGLLMGAAMLVKLTVAGLLPVLAISMLWPSGATTSRGRIARVAVAGGLSVLCLLPWFLINLHTYGSVTSGARGARVSDAMPHGLTADFIPQDLAVFVLTYWSGEPWGALPLSGALAVLGALISLMAALGIVKALRARPALLSRGPLAVAVSATALMTAVTLAFPATLGFEFLGPGRYAYPALPGAAALCAVGVFTILSSAVALRFLVAVYAAITIAMLAGGAFGWPTQPRAEPGIPPAQARVVAVAARGQFEGLIIEVDRVALDANGRAGWVHVTATNTGPGEIEWTVPGDYLRSTPMPQDLDPNESVSGWLYTPMDQAVLGFTGIATTGYQQVGKVDLRLTWP